MPFDLHGPRSVVLDVDGVLWIGGAPGKGAIAFLDSLAREGIPFCLLTNTCTVSKAILHKSLTQAGFTLQAEQLVTATEVTRDWLRDAAAHTIMYLGTPSALLDLTEGMSVCEIVPVDAVVVGDLFAHFDRGKLNRAAKAVNAGATLVAMQRNPHWSDGTDWYVDNGFWVAGLEFVTGQQAVVTGKPHRAAYQSALARLGQTADASSSTIFVSDDMAVDLKGAKDVGLTTVHFGPAHILPPWVDYSVRDFSSLARLLIGNRDE